MHNLAVLLAIAAPGCLFAASSLALPGCETRPEVRQVLGEKLVPKKLDELKFVDRVTFRRHVLEDLIAKYPREVEPHRRLLEATREDDIERMPELVDRYRQQAEQHPDDPLALYLAGTALIDRDTERAIKYLEQARRLAPDFPWAALGLAGIYAPGTKRADPQKAGDEIAAFFAACPASTDQQAQRRLKAGSRELQARVAAAIRARLATETDPNRLKDYATLWGIEFRTHSPQEYDAVRQQLAADLKRLETLNAKPGAAWLVFLKDGYKQSGAAAETVTAMEDRVIQASPRSEEAYQIVSDRWDKIHPAPEDQKDAAAWDKYRAIHREAVKGWIAHFTESRELQHQAWFDEIGDDPGVSPEEGLRALDDFLAEGLPYQRPSPGVYLNVGDFLLSHKWRPQQVLDLLRDSDRLMDEWHARMLGDNLAGKMEEIWAANEIILRQRLAGQILLTARLAERPAEAQRLVPFVNRDLPANSWETIEVTYWQNRGRLAMLAGKKADALTYYQKALLSRKRPLEPYQGRVIDDLTDEARALWNQLGGSETAWKLWIKPPSGIHETAETGWKRPDKDMPAFELADLSGKTWRLKDLEGRAVLINVWATWCEPCKAELPHLQKLYEKVKDRKDVQILTLTIDEDPGMVPPFMKEHAYTFPVLPAQSFVTSLLDVVAIPQNWILDSKGAWRWTGRPAVPDAEWEGAMLKQIEACR